MSTLVANCEWYQSMLTTLNISFPSCIFLAGYEVPEDWDMWWVCEDVIPAPFHADTMDCQVGDLLKVSES